MLNKEKFKDEILEIACNGESLALNKNTGKLTSCSGIFCSNCEFKLDACSCLDACKIWCNSEYKEPEVNWKAVPIDTPIYIKLAGNVWTPRYFSHYDNGDIYYFAGGKTSFTKLNEGGILKEDVKSTKLAREEDIEKYSK